MAYGKYQLIVQDLGHRLEHVARKVRAISHVELPAEAIEQAAKHS